VQLKTWKKNDKNEFGREWKERRAIEYREMNRRKLSGQKKIRGEKDAER
jgi:hypothetical protein